MILGICLELLNHRQLSMKCSEKLGRDVQPPHTGWRRTEKDWKDSNPGRPSPTQRAPMWRIGERPSDNGVRGDIVLPSQINWQVLLEGVAECTGGAVTPIKCCKSLTTESPGRFEAPVITSTPAVVQVVPWKNNYYRKYKSNERPSQEHCKHGRMEPLSLEICIYLGRKTDKTGVDSASYQYRQIIYKKVDRQENQCQSRTYWASNGA